jgi:hypothetical protein
VRQQLLDVLRAGLVGLWRTGGWLPEARRLLNRGALLRAAVAFVAFSAPFASAGVNDRARSPTISVRDVNAASMEAGPLWVSHATWDVTGERVVIADPGSGRIYLYDATGKIQRRIANPGQGALEFTKPNYAFLVRNQYRIATSLRRWITFDRDFVPESAWELDWEEGKGTYSQMAASEFDFSDTHLYTIGAALSFDGTWSDRAVFAVDLRDRAVRQVARLPKDEDETSYYHDPPFNLSVCGGKAWLLQMKAAVSIVEARDGAKPLRSFPDEFRRRPSVPRVVDAQSYPARRAALRQSPVAEGLFCADDRVLLLLAHRARQQGGLQWLVYPIDPLRDVMARPIELPTNAGEIVFVPGKKRWAVLEKGPMKYPGVQPLTRIVSFARPALTQPQEGTAR